MSHVTQRHEARDTKTRGTSRMRMPIAFEVGIDRMEVESHDLRERDMTCERES